MEENYKKIEFLCGNTIDDAVRTLMSYKQKSILVYGDFNGIRLYSDTVTLDGAYKEITGKTKEEFDSERKKWKEDYNKRETEHKGQIPELTVKWRKKGREILSEDKWEYWDRIVPIRLRDLYHGEELGCCLDIVKILNNNGTLDEAKAMIESQGHSGTSFKLVCSMVSEVSQRGKEFVEFIK